MIFKWWVTLAIFLLHFSAYAQENASTINGNAELGLVQNTDNTNNESFSTALDLLYKT